MHTLLAALMLAAAPAPAPSTTAPSTPPVVSMDGPTSPPEQPARKIRIYMTDGQQLNAVLLGEGKDRLRVRIGSGEPFDIARASVRAVEDAEQAPSPENYFPDPNLSRTFYAPTGFRLRAGQGYFSQKELLFSSFGYGVTDNISVMVGTVLPAWFAPGFQNVIGGVKIGTDIGDVWHLAAGAQGFALPGPQMFAFGSGGAPMGFAFVFGTATAGTPALNMTVSVGEAIHNLGGTGSNTVIAVGSASWRVHQNVALETENWFFPGIQSGGLNGEPFLMLNSVGVRLMNKNLAADLGFLRWPGSVYPFPWVDFTYTFGT
ncbi:MAG TPA: hypothetical protein VFA20_16365 [Myxococcaceae bacterium]|nr:hypothetical protein [Myxococcaceae bacterium]